MLCRLYHYHWGDLSEHTELPAKYPQAFPEVSNCELQSDAFLKSLDVLVE